MLRRWTAVTRIYVFIFALLISLVPVTNASAASSSLVIYQLQTGATGAATQEYISLFNNSDTAIDVTDWCVVYASSSDVTQTQLGCFAPPSANTKVTLPSYKTATLASTEFIAAHSGFTPDIVFSAGISGTSGHVRLFDKSKQEIDKLGWGSAVHPEGVVAPAHATGKVLQRLVLLNGLLQDQDNNAADFSQGVLSELPATALEEELVPVDACSNIDGFQDVLPEGYMLDQSGACQQDTCLNISGLQVDVPDGYQVTNDFCDLVPLESAVISITEMLPNVTGADTGKEFIELFNPNERSVNLRGYNLQVGPSLSKSYALPDILIPSLGFLALNDSQTGLVLSNTTAFLRLLAPSGEVVSTTAAYTDPKDDVAWAAFGSEWKATYEPTPNGQNSLVAEKPCDEGESRSAETGICVAVEVEDDTELTPCRADQERNPDTNRCRLIQTAVASLTACKQGQERNPETNRCRSVLASSNDLTPCKDGQERNPETNRCRNITQASVLGACAEGQERNPETNRCRKVTGAGAGTQLAAVKDVQSESVAQNFRWWIIAVAIFGALGYAVFEWRTEIIGIARKYIPKQSR